MKHYFMSILLGCCLLSPGMAGEGKVFPYPIQKETMDNGLQVVSVPFDSPGIVAFFVVVRVGSREEVEQGVTGFAHFFEHCMFRGTERFTQAGYDEALQTMAAGGNANTSVDRTLYYTVGSADKLEMMFDVESDRFQNLKYTEHGFKAEAGAVLGEYTKNYANPMRRLWSTIMSTSFKKHTYSHTTMGYLADIKDMPNQYEYSLSFYNRFYRPEYCTVMVVGDTNHGQVMELTKKYFGNWEKGDHQPEIPAEPEQTEARRGHVQHPGNTSMVAVHYKGPAFSDTDKSKVALDLMLELGFSSRSPIYQKLVNEEQKAVDIFPDADDTRDPFVLGAIAQLYKVEDTAYVRDQIIEVMEGFKNSPVDEKELAELKSRWKYSMAADLSTPKDVGEALARFIWLTGDPDALNRYYQTMDTVTAADIQNLAKQYLLIEKQVVVTLSSEEEGR